MALYDTPISALNGEPLNLDALRGRVVLVVKVASKRGLTPQSRVEANLSVQRT
jgi:glutathione peroxidase